MNKLVVLGSVNVDHLMQVVAFPRPGETITVQGYQTVAGGKGANQAVAAARLGADTQLIACVGEDPLGAGMKQGFVADGIDTSLVMEQPDQTTGMAMIYVNADGENNIGIWPGANAALTRDCVEAASDAIVKASVLLMQLETPLPGILSAARIASEAGVRVVLNPAPAKTLPEELLALVDIITPNETEAELLTGIAVNDLDGAGQAAQAFHRMGIASVLITLGSRGVWLSESGNGQHLPGFVVKAVDTTAAGDTFNGALMTVMLEGKSVLDAIPFAQAAAAISVTRLGAQTSIPSNAEVVKFLSQRR